MIGCESAKLLLAGALALAAVGCGGEPQPNPQGQPPGGSQATGSGSGTTIEGTSGTGTSGAGTVAQGTSGTAGSGTSASGTAGTSGASGVVQAPRSLVADDTWRPVAASSGVPRMLQAEAARDLSLFGRGEDDPVNVLPPEAAAQRPLRSDQVPQRELAPQRQEPRGIAAPQIERPRE
jgi:hypothetical protein